MSRHFDLDALRAARAEKRGEPPTVTLLGRDFTLPAELPFAVIEAFALDDPESFRIGVVSLIGENGLKELLAAGVTADDLTFLLTSAANDLYGVADPEASRVSVASSAGTSTPSKPTSDGSTGSI